MSVSYKIINLQFEEYSSSELLPEDEQLLLEKAKQVSLNAHAPYSEFRVGAAVLLENNEFVTGSNQENAAYPSGLCAERVALFYAGSRFPDVPIKTLVITCNTNHAHIDQPVTPCGACRQVISEYQNRQNKKIRIVMSGESGPILACDGVDTLLPLMFKGEFLK
jgi:cytidine deaminase